MWLSTLADIPAEKGSYVLLITLTRAASLPKRFGGALPPGVYLYFGSAFGPGGIGARVGRHMKRDKVVKWHVDYLTTRAKSVQAAVFPGANECDLRNRVQERFGLKAPVPGFGSSDCKTCPSHLLALGEDLISSVGLFLDDA